MTVNQRLEPLLAQYDWATERLLSRGLAPTNAAVTAVISAVIISYRTLSL